MDIFIREQRIDGCIVELRGRFDANEVRGFAAATDRLKEQGVADYAIDLSAVDFIDSSALAELVSLSRWATTAGGQVRLHRPSDPVRVILELTGLDAIFVVHDGADPAGSPRP